MFPVTVLTKAILDILKLQILFEKKHNIEIVVNMRSNGKENFKTRLLQLQLQIYDSFAATYGLHVHYDNSHKSYL